MELGIISDDAFEAALKKTQINGIVNGTSKGRPEGRENLPDIARKIIGDTAIESGRQEALEIGKLFDVSESSVKAYSNGATSSGTYNHKKPELANHLKNTKERISVKAARLTRRALNKIDDDKLDELDGVQLMQVAKGASAIVKEMEPDSPKGPINNGVQFVIQAPTRAREEQFEVIQVNE